MTTRRPKAVFGILASVVVSLAVLTACGTTQNDATGPGSSAVDSSGAAVVVPKKVAGGEAHTCAILNNGSLKCWGANTAGQLGQGDTAPRGVAAGQMGTDLPPIDLGKGRTALDVVAGGAHTCAILDDRSVKCWGRGQVGQLGLGNGTNQGDKPGEMGDTLPTVNLGKGLTAIGISAGKQHTCAVLNTGVVKCWGYNARGELGQGNTTTIGNRSDQMGDNLAPVRLGNGQSTTAITSGWYFNCALLKEQAVKCWGFNNYGQLGLGNTTNRGTSAGQMGDALPAVDLGTAEEGKRAGAIAVAAGGGQSCAQLEQSDGNEDDSEDDNGTLKCWGLNEQGQLGQGDTKNRGDQPGELGDKLPPINLGDKTDVEEIATGAYQTCALVGLNGKKREGTKCFGGNDKGQLGLGDTKNRGITQDQMGSALPLVDLAKTKDKDIVDIGLGGWQSCAILNSQGLKCWGGNESGQLGLGDTKNRGDQAGEMGKALPLVSLG